MGTRTVLSSASLFLCVALSASAGPEFWKNEWPNTDFGQTDVANWSEIMSGGPPKDGIPALSAPQFIPGSEETRIGEREPVITVEIEGETPRAYPVRYLIWHEIVNDEIGGVPVAVTFCPLCNSGVTFDRRLDGETLTFGVSGKLRHSDMVMFDRETESWWQQAIGRGIVGRYTGRSLVQLSSWMESWREFRERNPAGLVMAEPHWPRLYGRNPYVSYDSSFRPFLYVGELPPHDIPALARVVRVGERAWPVSRLKEEGVVSQGGVTITWREGQASALDTALIEQGREVGTIRVKRDGENVPHDIMFAFAFHAFFPDGEWLIE